jgi:hypothetical protein
MHREYPADDRSDIGFGSRLAHRRKPFINRLAYDVRESDATLAKRLRLAESFGIEPHIHQSRAHAVKITCLYSIAKSVRRPHAWLSNAPVRATACKLPRHRWHLQQYPILSANP